MRRIAKAALGGLAGCALVLGATQLAAGGTELTTLNFARRLIDVQTGASGPFDGAKARLQISETATGSAFTIQISGIGPTEEDQKFGAHVHTGTCVKGDGTAAGPHYQNPGWDPTDPTKLLSDYEVWFTIDPDENGTAISTTESRFTVDPGPERERSVVIHASQTNTTKDQFVTGGIGSAGPRLACLPVDYEDLQ